MDILRAAGILPQVSKHLDMRDKLALSHTSRAIRLEIFSVFVRQARTSLRTFVRDIATFLAWLDDHGAVISGSLVVSIMMCLDFGVKSDMDIYCPFDTAQCLVQYLTEYEEYKLVGKPDVSDHPYNETPWPDETNDLTKGEYWRFGGASLNQIIKLESPTGKGVDIIETFEEDPRELIFAFHSTVVVNALTPHGITCYYPALTFQNKNKSLNLSLNERTWTLIHEKWARRGFKPLYGVAPRQMTARVIDMGVMNTAPVPFELPCNLYGIDADIDHQAEAKSHYYTKHPCSDCRNADLANDLRRRMNISR